MEEFWKAVGFILIAVILGLTIEKNQKDYAAVLSMAVCVIAATIIFLYLEPVIYLLQELESLLQHGSEISGILIKAVGIALVAEVAAMVCCDSGNSTLGKTLQMLGTAAVLCMSIPIFQLLLTTVRDILGEVS